MDKSFILNEIKRTAEANGGCHLSTHRFEAETGIKPIHWRGKIWTRWGDAVREAGYTPSEPPPFYPDELALRRLAEHIRECGCFPVMGELRLKQLKDRTFPSAAVLRRFGGRDQLVHRVIAFCREHPEFADVVAICDLVVQKNVHTAVLESALRLGPDEESRARESYVYLAAQTTGKETFYKLGRALLIRRSGEEITIQLPDNLTLVHTIVTDDGFGIEGYWRRRFLARQRRGGWFALSAEDVAAFVRRKFM